MTLDPQTTRQIFQVKTRCCFVRLGMSQNSRDRDPPGPQQTETSHETPAGGVARPPDRPGSQGNMRKLISSISRISKTVRGVRFRIFAGLQETIQDQIYNDSSITGNAADFMFHMFVCISDTCLLSVFHAAQFRFQRPQNK